MKTKPGAIGLVFICTLVTSTAQILYKLGANRLSLDIFSLITNVPLFLGIILYVTAAAILLISLKYGELSVLYPVVATSYIWVSLLSSQVFGEVINASKWIGIIFIIVGVSLIGIGSRK
ncbi:hypothetical protein CMO89_01545 [Candidatus Woesearchaeota archaeon]|nr:hypothetical protein [Candidatus Woesearchaeota archaeon]|tara:strand:- start:7885 stop:8241 length:357 start_codon:yes stop_codon:yes gene_type:complete